MFASFTSTVNNSSVTGVTFIVVGVLFALLGVGYSLYLSSLKSYPHVLVSLAGAMGSLVGGLILYVVGYQIGGFDLRNGANAWVMFASGAVIGIGGLLACWWHGIRQDNFGEIVISFIGGFGLLMTGIVLYGAGCWTGRMGVRYGTNGQILRFLQMEWVLFLIVAILIIAGSLAIKWSRDYALKPSPNREKLKLAYEASPVIVMIIMGAVLLGMVSNRLN